MAAPLTAGVYIFDKYATIISTIVSLVTTILYVTNLEGRARALLSCKNNIKLYKIQGYIERSITDDLLSDLALFPAVALIGPRQCGKSRLAKRIAEDYPDSVHLDLENCRAQ